jgi:peptide/nickel transport system substrate-binding protein
VSYIVNSNLYDSLVSTDTAFGVVPALAIRWITPDDLTWILDLREGVRFHDGSPFTSADAAYSLLRARDAPESAWRAFLATVSAVDATSPSRLVLRTTRPSPLLLRYLAAIAIVPKRYTETHDLAARPVGTGPYRLVGSPKATDALQLARWEGFWGPAPAIETVTLRVIPDAGRRSASLLSGQVDMLTDVPPGFGSAGHTPTDVRLLRAPGLRQMFLGFDMARSPTPYVDAARNPFLDRRVRIAVQSAIDTHRLVGDLFSQAASEADQLVAPGVTGYDPAWRRPPFDPAAARRLLSEAGWPDGFSVTLDAPRDVYLADTAVADRVAAYLDSVGIHVRVNKMPKADFFKKLEARDTSLYMMSWNCLTADMQEVFNSLLHTPDMVRGLGRENVSNYTNPRLDALVEEASQTTTHEERVRLLRSASDIALEDAPWVPLYVQDQVYALRRPFEWTPRQDKRVRVAEFTVAD